MDFTSSYSYDCSGILNIAFNIMFIPFVFLEDMYVKAMLQPVVTIWLKCNTVHKVFTIEGYYIKKQAMCAT